MVEKECGVVQSAPVNHRGLGPARPNTGSIKISGCARFPFSLFFGLPRELGCHLYLQSNKQEKGKTAIFTQVLIGPVQRVTPVISAVKNCARGAAFVEKILS